jgi:hypothetical protein
MAIVIKEILASDTVSQLSDKINFNFDQLMINGGGPAGPIGPIGPIGPVGPRGSVWFDGAGAPTTIIGAEEGDYYLDTTTGDVYLYDGSSWTLEGNIMGPQGPVGPQGPGNILFQIDGSNPDVNPANYYYRYRFVNANSDLYTTSGVWSSQSLLVGAFPEGTNSNDGIASAWGEITDVYSNQINPSVGSMFVHMPIATSGKNIILSRVIGDGISTFNTDVVTEMGSISVDDYDSVFIESNRIINSSDLYAQNIGLKVASYDSDLSLISGRNINITTQSPVTAYNSSIFGADIGNGIISITALESTASGYAGSAVRLQKGSGSTYGHAYIGLGTGNPTLQPSAGDGSILIKNTTGDNIDIDSSGSLNLIANEDINVASDAIYLDATVLGKINAPTIVIGDDYFESASGKVIFGAASLTGNYNTGQIFLVRETSNSVNTAVAQSGYDFVLRSINYTGNTSIPEGSRYGRIVGQINTTAGGALDNLAGISFETDSGASFSGGINSRIRFLVSRDTTAAFEQRMELTKNGYLKFLWDANKSTSTNRDAKIFLQSGDSSEPAGAAFTIKGSDSYASGFSAYNGGKIIIEGGDGYSAGGSFGFKGNIHLNPWHSLGYVQNSYGVKIGGNTTSGITASLAIYPMVSGSTTYALDTHSLQIYDTAGVERFGLKNDGTLSVGLKFPGTQVTSSDANTLDDYEEGAWTPGVTVGSGSVSLNTSSGVYTKIGRMVTATGYLNVSSSTGSGFLRITNLPFTCSNSDAAAGPASFYYDVLNASPGQPLMGYVVKNTTYILIESDSSGSGIDAAGVLATGSIIKVTVTYIV